MKSQAINSKAPIINPLPPPVSEKKKIGAFSHFWQTIKHLPTSLRQFIARISKSVKSIFHCFETKDASKKKAKVTAGDVNAAHGSTAIFKGIYGNDDQDLGLNRLFDLPQETEKAADPLKTMGAVAPPRTKSRFFGSQAKSAFVGDSEFNTELFVAIKAIVKPAEDLLTQLRTQPSPNYDLITRKLNEEYILLQEYARNIKEPPAAQKLIQQTIVAIQLQMGRIGAELIMPAEVMLKEVRAQVPGTLQEYLMETHLLDQQFESLKKFASRFETCAPSTHRRLQDTLKELEKQKTALDADMCAQVHFNFRPNPSIPGLGNCLFESIRDQLKNVQNQTYYRRLAVQYMRQHTEQFEIGILDAMDSHQAKACMARYAQTITDKNQNWENELTKKLNRKPEPIDFYFDCMENYTLWGGTNEILALSEMLKVPILVFTERSNSKLRIDLMAGTEKYLDKAPLLLYFNGVNHYQDLV